MATMLACDFTFFERTPQEARAGAMLTIDNIQNIQNLLALAATEKLNLEDDPNNQMLTSLRRAKLDGEIGAYRMLILSSQAAMKENYDEAKEAADLQEQKQRVLNAYAAFSEPTKIEVNPDAVVTPTIFPTDK